MGKSCHDQNFSRKKEIAGNGRFVNADRIVHKSSINHFNFWAQ